MGKRRYEKFLQRTLENNQNRVPIQTHSILVRPVGCLCKCEFQLLHIRDLSVLTCFERASRQVFLADLDSGGLGPHVFALWLSSNAST